MIDVQWNAKRVVLAERVDCEILDTETQLLYLIPEDWDTFWEVWHAHKAALKRDGLHVFMKTSGTRKPDWTLALSRQQKYRNS